MPKNVLLIWKICIVELSALRMVTLRDAQHKEKLPSVRNLGAQPHRGRVKPQEMHRTHFKAIVAGLVWFGVFFGGVHAVSFWR